MQKHSFLSYLAIGCLLFAGLFGLVPPTTAHAAPPATANAYEVIHFGAQDTIVREISFSTAKPISGLTALKLSGLHVVTLPSSFGAYVCSINGVGDCSGTAPYYWGYYQWNATNSVWDFSSVGASDSTVSAGGLEGWAYLSYTADTSQPGLIPAVQAEAVPPAAAYVKTQQNIGTGGYSSNGDSAEALLAVASDGYPPSAWAKSGGKSFGSYWTSHGAAYALTGADAGGKLAVGLQAGCACWPASAKHPSAFYDSNTGLYTGANGTGSGPQAWAILGSLSLRDSVPSLAVTTLEGMVQSDGGWEWQPTFGSDTNTTALVIQALLETGESPSSTLITNALAYLKSAQQSDGGIAYTPTTSGSDADSSAYTVMAIQAAGGNPTSADWTKSGNTPISYLLSLQLSNGSFEWQKGLGANLLATDQTITALLGDGYQLNANFSISGKVITGTPASGLKGVKVTFGPYSATTGSDGKYTILSIPPGSKGTLTASLADYVFSPASVTIPVMTSTLGGKNFTASPVETISGTVSGLGGQIIKIGYGSGKTQLVSTDGSGSYQINNLPENVGYTLTPLSPAAPNLFRFSPAFISIPAGNGNTSSANFTATAQVLMSGTVTVQGKAVSGVTVSAAGFSTLTNSHGRYSLEVPKSSTVTPSATHPFFTFTDTITPLTSPTTDNNFTQNWSQAEVNISGNVTLIGAGLPGVVLMVNSDKGKPPVSTTTDSNGAYSLTVHDTDTPDLFSFGLTPSFSYFTFSPKSQTFSSTGGVVKNFAASYPKWIVSGLVTLNSKGLGGVEIDATINGVLTKVITDSSGAYTINGVPSNAIISLAAKKYGYTFSSANISIIVGQADMTGQNFSATPQTLDKTISGVVTLSGKNTPLAGVVMTLTYKGERIFTVKTGQDGSYSFPNLYADNGYVVMPSLAKYSFTSPSINIDLTNASASGQNFSATHVK